MVPCLIRDYCPKWYKEKLILEDPTEHITPEIAFWMENVFLIGKSVRNETDVRIATGGYIGKLSQYSVVLELWVAATGQGQQYDFSRHPFQSYVAPWHKFFLCFVNQIFIFFFTSKNEFFFSFHFVNRARTERLTDSSTFRHESKIKFQCCSLYFEADESQSVERKDILRRKTIGDWCSTLENSWNSSLKGKECPHTVTKEEQASYLKHRDKN